MLKLKRLDTAPTLSTYTYSWSMLGSYYGLHNMGIYIYTYIYMYIYLCMYICIYMYIGFVALDDSLNQGPYVGYV